MKRFCMWWIGFFERLEWLPLLLLRLVLANGFLMPALLKIRNFESVVKWFETIGFPYPKVAVFLSGSLELTGCILLLLGLCTRLITIPLIVIMAIAISVVHWKFGFASANNGFEIPFYFALMLFVLLIFGPGKVSLDAWIKKRYLS